MGRAVLQEPVERVRELQDDEAEALDDAMRDDYGPFFDFVRASGLRQTRVRHAALVGGQLRHQADRAAGQGRQARVFPITDTIREILFPLQGQHPEFVFTYVACTATRGSSACAASVTR